jgi:hypothetical protein
MQCIAFKLDRQCRVGYRIEHAEDIHILASSSSIMMAMKTSMPRTVRAKAVRAAGIRLSAPSLSAENRLVFQQPCDRSKALGTGSEDAMVR